MSPSPPHAQLPPEWQVPFDLWREQAYGPLSRKLAGMQEVTPGGVAFLPLQGAHPKLLDSLASAWRQQLFEGTVWRLLAELPADKVSELRVNPKLVQVGSFQSAIQFAWTHHPDAEAEHLFGTVVRQLESALLGAAKNRKDAVGHRMVIRADRPRDEPRKFYVLADGRTQLLRQLADDLGGRPLAQRMEAYLVTEALEASVPESTAPRRSASARL